MARINEVDRRVLAAMGGREKLKLLLAERGLNLTTFAERHNRWVEDVSRCIGGERPLPEIRDALAAELEMDRAAIDALIDGPDRKAG